MFFTVPIAADPASTAAPSSARHHRRAQRPTSARQKRTPSSSDFTTRSKTASSALADPMLKDRIAELKAIRDQARADAERADGASDRLGPAHLTPAALKTFAMTARRRMRTGSGGDLGLYPCHGRQ